MTTAAAPRTPPLVVRREPAPSPASQAASKSSPRVQAPAWLRAVVLFVLAVAPLPLACAAADARAALATALAIVTATTLLVAAQRRLRVVLPFGFWPLLALCGLGCVQLLPALTSCSPAQLELLGGHAPATISVVPVRTAARLLEWAAALGLFVTAATLFHSPRRVRVLFATLAVVAVLQVLYGVALRFGVAPALSDQQTTTVAVGTYVNRNHFAGLLELAALTSLGLGLALRVKGAPAWRASACFVAVAACLVGIVLSGSRAGLVVVLLGGLGFVLAIVQQRALALRIAGVGAALAVVAAALLLPDDLTRRLASLGGELAADGTRPDIWRGALALFAAFPWLGAGFGTYGDLSPSTQHPSIPGRLEHAHNDPLEILVEGGIVGGLLLAAALACFWLPVVRRCLAESERERRLLAAGGAAALAVMTLHELVDFNLQMPANLAIGATIAGAVCGTLRPAKAPGLPRRSVLLAAALALVVAFGNGWRTIDHARLDGLEAVAAGHKLLARDPERAHAFAAAALAQNPFSPRAHRLLASAALARGVSPQPAFAAALRWTNPADRPWHQLEVATECLAAGDAAGARAWLEDLLPNHPELRRLLRELYRIVPSAEVLAAVLPQASDVRGECAEVLLKAGDFVGRELLLAAPGAEPVPLTIGDGLQLATCDVDVAPNEGALEVHVVLTFRRQPGTRASLVLRCEHPDAAIYRSFDVDGDVYRHTFRLDSTFPPGDYELNLDFRADAPHWPFGWFQVVGEPLVIGGDSVGATELWWSTAVAGRRLRPKQTVPLRSGDVLWRPVRLPPDAAELVVHTARSASLGATFDGVPLVPRSVGAGSVQRFALPRGGDGELRLFALAGEAPEVRELFVIQATGTEPR